MKWTEEITQLVIFLQQPTRKWWNYNTHNIKFNKNVRKHIKYRKTIHPRAQEKSI